MNNRLLTGIERSLVIQFLLDSSLELEAFLSSSSKAIQLTSSSKIEKIKFINQNILPVDYSSVCEMLSGRDITVQFYFNNLGLFFNSKLLKIQDKYFLQLPEAFYKISDKNEKIGRFSARLSYDCSDSKSVQKSKTIDIFCSLEKDYPLFIKPALNSIKENNLQKANAFIESAVHEAKYLKKNIGNGLFLISAARYLLEYTDNDIESIKGRIKSPSIIYMDDERIVFASRKSDMILNLEKDYEIEFSFPISGPLKERKVKAVFFVESMYESIERSKLCANAVIKTIKEEDKRFIRECSVISL